MKKFFSWLSTFVIGYIGSIIIVNILIIFVHLIVVAITLNIELVLNNYILLMKDILMWFHALGLMFGIILMAVRLDS
jgi:hypothetical protein